MKSSRFRMAIAATTVFALLAGCSSSTTTEPNASNAPSPSGAPTGSSAPTSVNGKYDPPIDITTVGQNWSVIKYANGESRTDNAWTKAYSDQLGIRLKYNWVVDSTQYATKLNLSLTSGDLPDFLSVDGVQFKQLLEADLIQDLTEVYKQYAPESYKNMIQQSGPKPMQAATVNGKLMAFPFTGNGKEATQVVWIRTDWLKKLGLSEPKTMDDLFKIAEAFTTQDPDGNGKNDTFGFALDKDFSYHSFVGFVNSYHAYRNMWIKSSQGSLVYGDVQPEMKNALGKLQDLYKKGLLDKEFPVKDTAKVNEDLAAGKVGITFIDTSAAAGVLQKVKDNNPNAEWDAYPLLSIDSQPAKPQVTSTGPIAYWVVKKGYKHPEAVLKMIDFFIQSYYLTKDEKVTQTYISSLEGVPNYLLTAASSYMPYNNLTTQTNVSSVLEGKKQVADLNPLDRAWYNRIIEFKNGNNAYWGINKCFGINGARSIAIKYIENNMLMENEFFVASTPVMSEKLATLEKLRDTTFINIITGSAGIDSFDKFVDDWKKTGGDQITKEVNDWYKTLK
ncbi:hypothetical protein [Paenibacillus sp. HJGM_3]|uniref:hypothetical protein n=1 Tax=Paenibacillus sp. HJGM_3 TaxID=3379816 RepID=UPI00385E2D75